MTIAHDKTQKLRTLHEVQVYLGVKSLAELCGEKEYNFKILSSPIKKNGRPLAINEVLKDAFKGTNRFEGEVK